MTTEYAGWRPDIPPASMLTSLDNARRKHPSYRITWHPATEPSRMPRYMAIAVARDVHPVVVISTDLADLSANLDPRDAGTPAADPIIIPLRELP